VRACFGFCCPDVVPVAVALSLRIYFGFQVFIDFRIFFDFPEDIFVIFSDCERFSD
jgi:hypothetical protein